ncbi:ion transporter [Lipingzhangella rawalii]|uniref:ion transporter n=1 Tax=Lipingzhangella rawalii TaxID=2055835 RepID=UPI00287B8FCC|nr:ion transporter [Lipingzhangella rawalii]
MTLRERVQGVVEAPFFQNTIITLIVVNGVVLGMETSPEIMDRYGELLLTADGAMLSVFVVELALRIYAYRGRFFTDPWSVFDFVIVAIALIPASGPFAVLRVLRILRVLRLLTMVPPLRRVVAGLLRALPGMASIGALLGLLMYVAAVMATKLFQETDPRHFADLPTSMATLFQIMTGDSWGAIARELSEDHMIAWPFFVLFILASTFIALNLFIAVAVDALPPTQVADEDFVSTSQSNQDAILAELRSLRSEVAELRSAQGGTETTAQPDDSPGTPPDTLTQQDR